MGLRAMEFPHTPLWDCLLIDIGTTVTANGFLDQQVATSAILALPQRGSLGQLAFNLLAWFKRLVLPPTYHRTTIKTIRHHLLNLAGKLVHTARRCFLMISDQYRYQPVWRFAIDRLAHLQFG